ncbi:energy-coupling factor transporter transmembrane protein EcfT [Infirmifilum lucidum]|uniref:Energy-coupling factor transporter transmembrane protein EcfT n=1 Tax=Infirmifilum lucidum TaxID=2776706 RepID=A0A7L9FGV2_9CREN|nr:energy-coupling factor transporter transmembrane component T [Infirmifilum lucidum]QOJ78542.1 energy-coupling factor transporter transmembrane protein EcfT [Infirmifilum lucidum]
MDSLKRLNPVVKLTSLLIAIFHVALLQNVVVTISHLLLALSLAILSRPKVNRVVATGIASTLIGYTWVTYTLYVVNVKLDPQIALAKTLLLSSRILIVMLYSLFFASTTRPKDLATSMTLQLKVPYEYAFLSFVTLRMFPIIKRDLENIIAFRKMKGYIKVSRPWNLILSMITPLLFTTVRRSVLMGISMEARGFGKYPKRTFLYETQITPRDIAFLLSVLSVVSASTLFSYILGAPLEVSL